MGTTDSPDRKMIEVATLISEDMGSGYTVELDQISSFIDTIKDSEPGDKWRIEIKEMDKEEYNKLPEFEGF